MSGPVAPGDGAPVARGDGAPVAPGGAATAVRASVVVPTLNRPSLTGLLDALGADGLPDDVEIILVDDRRPAAGPMSPAVHPLPVPDGLTDRVRVLPGRAAGPAAARNIGWRAARGEWVAFLDDDVVPERGWTKRLLDDLTTAAPGVGGVQGRLTVPLPEGRRPTDWERSTAGLARARWITADIAYRRRALAAVDGFDERFPRAYREDAELAWRVRHAGWALTVGRRRVVHPVRPEGPWVSLRVQRGNADDALLRRLYGGGWRDRLEAPPGRRRRHAAVATAGLLALAGAAAGRYATGRTGRVATGLALTAGTAWLAGTTEFAYVRIAPGPRTATEVGRMLVTSALIPPLAVTHWVRGWLRTRDAAPWPRLYR